MSIEVPLGPREQGPDKGLLAVLEKAGVDNALGRWLRSLPADDLKEIDTAIFNGDDARPADIKFIESADKLAGIQADMEGFLTLVHAHQFLESRALGKSISAHIAAAAG